MLVAQGWPVLLNVGAAYNAFQKFLRIKLTWIGWHGCVGVGFQAADFLYLVNLLKMANIPFR
jgi:hypothetical protein